MQKRLLINWVYYQPIGHAMEAFRFGQAWKNANPDLEVAVALNNRSAIEAGACVPAIDTVYPVDLDELRGDAKTYPSIQRIPPDWDYIFTDPRHETPMGDALLDRCEHVMQAHLNAALRNTGWSLPVGFPAARMTPLALDLPDTHKAFATAFVSSAATTRICLLFGSGTEASRTPPLTFWRTLIRHLERTFNKLELIIFGSFTAQRSATQGMHKADIDDLLAEFACVRDASDLGLLNQLAIAEMSQLFISPHTGFGFAIQAVGVPWLILSGSYVAEYWINGVPFVSVYPDCPRYPCDFWSPEPARPMLEACRTRRTENKPYLCLTTETLEHKLPHILQSAQQLIQHAIPYHVCARQHYDAMIPRLGLTPGQPFIEGWPDALDETFRFSRTDSR